MITYKRIRSELIYTQGKTARELARILKKSFKKIKYMLDQLCKKGLARKFKYTTSKLYPENQTKIFCYYPI